MVRDGSWERRAEHRQEDEAGEAGLSTGQAPASKTTAMQLGTRGTAKPSGETPALTYVRGHAEPGTTRKVRHLSRELYTLGAGGPCYARSTEPVVAGP